MLLLLIKSLLICCNVISGSIGVCCIEFMKKSSSGIDRCSLSFLCPFEPFDSNCCFISFTSNSISGRLVINVSMSSWYSLRSIADFPFICSLTFCFGNSKFIFLIRTTHSSTFTVLSRSVSALLHCSSMYSSNLSVVSTSVRREADCKSVSVRIHRFASVTVGAARSSAP